MRYKDLKIDGQKVILNNKQSIFFDTNSIQKNISEIKFPVLIVDTEFFNRSHDWEKTEPHLYDEQNKDQVYLINYSFAKSFKEIEIRNNFKSINNLSIKRKPNDLNYDFKKQHDSMFASFMSMCFNKNIKTVIFAGQDNDKKILENWINSHKSLFHNRKSDLFILNKETNTYKLNSFDIYDLLEQTLSFTNFDSEGNKFYNENNLKNGQKEQTIALRSLKKFFNYTRKLHTNVDFEEEDITFLCTKALKFYSLKELDEKQHAYLSKFIKDVKKHCYNDVLKILLLIKFINYIYWKIVEKKDE
ncbi:hypothetical protein EELLY_v1c02230 [Entomoplasma ellychniae]|uniref:Exonuclease n=1 Tax=Entomoplasma ellychniae TaxID=2114 RepID=A0A8E2QX60_9MOLU|nr:hypothetical protein [Entomoplasma ellychniae]PPE04543.1 hypothetical protein EELLY_v1c02230 [Entomoplasma ellychniae]